MHKHNLLYILCIIREDKMMHLFGIVSLEKFEVATSALAITVKAYIIMCHGPMLKGGKIWMD